MSEDNSNKGENSNIDIILGDSHVAIRRLAWPMMVSMLLVMLYNLADSVWVAGLGADSLAAIGFVTPVFMIVIGLGNGVGAGANSLIARFIGARDFESANNAALHSILISVILSVVFAVFFAFALPSLLDLMGAGSAKSLALTYGYIVFILNFVFVFNGVFTAILRSEGDVNRAMYVTAITAVLNIFLDPVFIYVFGWGISGAAWATVVSCLVSCIVIAYWMWVKKDTYLDLNFGGFHYDSSIFRGILNVAVPSTAENLIFSILGIVENYLLVMVAGTLSVAVYTAGMRLIQMAMIPLIGLGTAALTVIGAAYGEKNIEKLDDAFMYTLKLGVLISIVMMVIFYVFAPQISYIFSYSSASSVMAPKITELLRIIFVFIIAATFGMIPAMMFHGVGKGFTSLLLTMCRALIFEICFSYLFGVVFALGDVGVYLGVSVGGCVGGVISFVVARLYIRSLKRKFLA